MPFGIFIPAGSGHLAENNPLDILRKIILLLLYVFVIEYIRYTKKTNMSLTSITPTNISHRHGKTEHAPILHKELQTTEESRELEKCSSLGKSILFVCLVPKLQLENICIIYIIWT